MSADEFADVLPTGYLDGSMSAAEVYQHSRSGAIPASYVRDAARDTLGVAFASGAFASALAVMVLYSGVLTHLL